MEISFGGNPSIDDKRTITADVLDRAGVEIPEQGVVPLFFPSCDDLCNQRKVGICTACGTRMAVEEARAIADAVTSSRHTERLSEYWLYIMGKVLVDGNLREGSSALTMLKTAKNYGVPLQAIEEKYPLPKDLTYDKFVEYFYDKYDGVIPEGVLNDAKNQKILGYYKVTVSPVDLAREITNGKVLVCRFAVGDNTYKASDGRISWAERDLLPLRRPTVADGGHIWCINEYKGLDNNQWLKGPNSWSDRWGSEGYFYFYFKDQVGYFTEAWAIGEVPQRILDDRKRNDFKVDLKLGMSHPDVKRLQQYLNNHGYTVSFIGQGSKGKETEYFGTKTQKALIKFQKKNNIFPAIGYFGTVTRGILNSLK